LILSVLADSVNVGFRESLFLVHGGITMAVKYVVGLTEGERRELIELVSKGQAAAYRIKHANVLLKVDADGPNWTDAEAAEAYSCHVNTVSNIRRRFVNNGLTAALERKRQNRPSRERVFDGAKEAKLMATACSEPPAGRAHWTMQLLADRVVELKIVDSVSRKTVERTLKKSNCSRTARSAG
jgi:hypothetical protein